MATRVGGAGGGQSYSSTELSPERLLALIEAQGAAPVIEPPSVDAYEQVFRQALAQSDEVLSLHLSSRLSVSFACGQEAARAFGSRVRVLDSPAGSYALGLQALRAARLAAGATTPPPSSAPCARCKRGN